MSNSDKKMREILDGADLKEIGHSLDRNALWNKIAPDDNHVKKSRLFIPWITHTAAVAAGILLAVIIGMNLHLSENTTVAGNVTTPVNTQKILHDTVFIEQPDMNTTAIAKGQKRLPPPIIRKQQPIRQEAPAIDTPEQTIAISEKLSVIDSPENKVVAKVVVPKPLPVMHLTDMNNENSRHYGNQPTEDGYALFHKLKIPANTADRSETISMLVVNHFSR